MMKHQNNLSTYAATVALFVLLSMSAATAQERQQSGITAAPNGTIVEDKNGNSVIIVPDKNATTIKPETTQIVTEQPDGSVKVSQTTVLNVPDDKAEEVAENVKKGDKNWLFKFFDALGFDMDDEDMKKPKDCISTFRQ